jgi:Glycosyltransferase sugar-binding region containing DXD motif
VIPNRVHFCWGFAADFGGKPFSLVHYLAIRSAVEVNRPQAAQLYCKHLPEGPWWERAKPLVDVVPVEPPATIHGVPVHHHAHQTDFVRLQKLYAVGGVYLDLDVLCLRPFAPLREHPVVLGQEGEDGAYGLCNAVILAEPGAFLLARWLEGFDPERSLWHGFRSQGADRHWGEMAVRYPAMIADRYPRHVHVVGPRAFFWPTWSDRDLRLLFRRDGESFADAYCVHLWEQRSWDRYLSALTPERIRAVDTNFNRLARRFL